MNGGARGFSTDTVKDVLEGLLRGGSVAAPGFANPEGIIVFHVAANSVFKVTEDDQAKGQE